MPNITVLEIPSARLKEASQLVARHAKKALQRGEVPPALRVVEAWSRYYRLDRDGGVREYSDRTLPQSWRGYRLSATPFVTVEVTGLRPVIGGHRFRATLERTPHGTILREVPSEDGPPVPARYRDATSSCDHCKIKRRRNDVYLLERVTDGHFVQVGRQCLQEYLGDCSPAAWLSATTIDRSLLALQGGDAEGGGGYSAPVVSTRTFLAAVASSIRTSGYRGRGSSCTTGNDVYTSLTQREANAVLASIEDRDYDLGDRALAWMREEQGCGDYRHNLRVAALHEAVGHKMATLLGSGVQAYLRDRGLQLGPVPDLHEHVPDVAAGDRIALRVTLVRVTGWESEYGWVSLLTFRDDQGRAIVWRSSSAPDVEQGDLLTIVGTVKALDEYRGVPQTLLTRVKVLARNHDVNLPPNKASRKARCGTSKANTHHNQTNHDAPTPGS